MRQSYVIARESQYTNIDSLSSKVYIIIIADFKHTSIYIHKYMLQYKFNNYYG